MKKLSLLFATFTLSVLVSAPLMADDHDHAGHDHKGHDHKKADDHKGGHVKPSHKGHVLEVGKHVAHIELVHNKKEGTVELYILDKAGKALAIADAPRLNLKYNEGKTKTKKKKQLKTEPQGAKDKLASKFKVTANILKGDAFEGKISIKIKDKRYQVALPHKEHAGHDHKGHKH